MVLKEYSGVLALRLGFQKVLDRACHQLETKGNRQRAPLCTRGRVHSQPLWPCDWPPAAGDGDRWLLPSAIWGCSEADLHSDRGSKEHICRSFFYPVQLRQRPLLVQEQHLGILPETPEDFKVQQQTSLQTSLRTTLDQKGSERIKTRAQDCVNLAAIFPSQLI